MPLPAEAGLRGATGRIQAAVNSAGGAEGEQRLLDLGVEARPLEAGAVLPWEHDHCALGGALRGQRQCLRRGGGDLAVEVYPTGGCHGERCILHLGRRALRLQLLRRCRSDERDGQRGQAGTARLGADDAVSITPACNFLERCSTQNKDAGVGMTCRAALTATVRPTAAATATTATTAATAATATVAIATP